MFTPHSNSSDVHIIIGSLDNAGKQPISLKLYLVVVKAIDMYRDESSLGLITRNEGKVIEQINIMDVKDLKNKNW